MNHFKNVVITGASQGIGKAFSESFAQRGANVLLVSRNEDRLNQVAQDLEKRFPNIRASVFPLDLARSDSAKKLREHCEAISFSVDALVNNAGYGVWGKFSELSLQEQLDCLQVNGTTLVQLCYEFLPLLKKNAQAGKKAGILNVSSMTAYQAIPTFAIYAAVKSFVLSFSRALHHELIEEGVIVTALVPGTTESGFIYRAKMEHTEKRAKKVMMSAESVAEAGVRGFERGKVEVIPGGLNIMMAGATRFLSKNLLESAAKGIYRKS